jgi:hypothetical protein
MTNNRTQSNQNFKQIEGDSWISIYLPAICAGIVMTIVLFMAVSCSKKSDKPVSNISAPTVPSTTNSTPTASAAATPEAPKKAAKRHRPASATYVNGTYGVSFSYPRKYSLQSGDKQSTAPMQNSFLKSGAVQVATVDMPDDSYPDTDFSSALLNVSVNPGMTTEDCSQFVAGSKDAGEVKPNTVKLGSNEFSEFEQINGEGNRKSDLKYFHLFKNGACYEFALDVDTTVKTDGDLAQVDRGKVFHQLEKILASARIKEVEMPGVESAEKAQPTDESKPEAATQPTATDSSKTEKAEVVRPEQK